MARRNSCGRNSVAAHAPALAYAPESLAVCCFKVRNPTAVYAKYEQRLRERRAQMGSYPPWTSGGGGDAQRRRFHGTALAAGCSFGCDAHQPPCAERSCAVCRICEGSFDVARAGSGPNGGEVMDLRYGRGL